MKIFKPKKYEEVIVVIALASVLLPLVIMEWKDTKIAPLAYPIIDISRDTQTVATSTNQFITKKTSQTVKKGARITKEARQIPGNIIGHDINISNVLNAINQQRYSAGLEVLKENTSLDQAAGAKLKDMQDKKYFAHQSPEGKWPWDFIKDAGYKYKYAGENLAGPKIHDDGTTTYFADITDLTNTWMGSPLHKENILKEQYTETGIAVSTDGHLIVQLFAKPI